MLFTVLQTFDHHKNYHIHGMRAAWCAYCVHEPTTAVQAIIALQKGKEVPEVPNVA